MSRADEPNKRPPDLEDASTPGEARRKAKFEVYGEEMIEKEVKQSGNSGRVYLPPEWVGKNVKIIRID
jgi:putative transposon-encoded protein